MLWRGLSLCGGLMTLASPTLVYLMNNPVDLGVLSTIFLGDAKIQASMVLVPTGTPGVRADRVELQRVVRRRP